MIEVNNLTKIYGRLVAVDDLSFRAAPGEVLGFLGPNGAGKTTTMKIVSGFLTPTSGNVSIFGHRTDRDTINARRAIGYLPEGAPAYGEMEVDAYLSFAAEMRGFPARDRKALVSEAVAQLSLEEVRRQRIETLSKGFRRRVGIAQAILHNPQALLLDEPTDGLDPNQKHQVRELIKNLASDKIVVISTHILEEVDAVCSRAIIIDKGRLVADGTPTELEAKSKYHGALRLRFAAPLPDQRPLKEMAGVAAVESESEDQMEFTLLPKPGAELLPIADALIHESGWKITGMFLERGRLDDVFRTLTIDS